MSNTGELKQRIQNDESAAMVTMDTSTILPEQFSQYDQEFKALQERLHDLRPKLNAAVTTALAEPTNLDLNDEKVLGTFLENRRVWAEFGQQVCAVESKVLNLKTQIYKKTSICMVSEEYVLWIGKYFPKVLGVAKTESSFNTLVTLGKLYSLADVAEDIVLEGKQIDENLKSANDMFSTANFQQTNTSQ